MEVLLFPFSAYPLIFAKFREYTFQSTKRCVVDTVCVGINTAIKTGASRTLPPQKGGSDDVGGVGEGAGQEGGGEGAGEGVDIIHISYR